MPTAKTRNSLQSFSDAGDVSDYAKTVVDALIKAGIISGIGGKATPNDTSKRAQMAQVLYNLLSK